MIVKLAILFLLGTISESQSLSCPPAKLIYPCQCGSEVFFTCKLSNGNYTAYLKVEGQIAKLMKDNDDFNYVLTLESIQISKLSKELFAGMRVHYINIHGSDISDIQTDAFKDTLNSLVSVSISTSKLTNIPFAALSNIKRLDVLDVIDSSIKSIAKSEIDELPSSITWLLLSYNKISTIESNALDKLVNLKYLYLDHNLLTSFIIIIPPKLIDLDLSYNRIKEIGDIYWSKIPKGTSLDLQYNDITALPIKEILEIMLIKKISIGLGGNKIICDCGTKWSLKMLRVLLHYLEDVVCAPGSGKRTSKNFQNLVKDDYSDC